MNGPHDWERGTDWRKLLYAGVRCDAEHGCVLVDTDPDQAPRLNPLYPEDTCYVIEPLKPGQVSEAKRPMAAQEYARWLRRRPASFWPQLVPNAERK